MEKTLDWALVRPEFVRIDLGPEHVQLTLFIYLFIHDPYFHIVQ